MSFIRRLSHLSPVVAVLVFAACVQQGQAATHHTSLLVIAPVDVSVSWPARSLDRAIAAVGDILDSLQGGDRLVVRSITESSNSGDDILLDVTIPVASSAGQFDQAGRIKAIGVAKRADSIRMAAREQLSKIRTLRHPRRTDIVGALYAAAELAATQERRTIVVPCTDGRDDGGNLGVRLDLTGLDVRFVAFEGTQLGETTRLKAAWTKRLEAAGARSVAFVPAGESLALASFRAARGAVQASAK